MRMGYRQVSRDVRQPRWSMSRDVDCGPHGTACGQQVARAVTSGTGETSRDLVSGPRVRQKQDLPEVTQVCLASAPVLSVGGAAVDEEQLLDGFNLSGQRLSPGLCRVAV